MKQKLIIAITTMFMSQGISAQSTTGLPKALLYDSAGNTVSTSAISDFDNPVVVVTYAIKWCPPCIKMLDSVDKNYSAKAGIKIVAVNVESGIPAEELYNHARRWKNIEVLNDRDGQFMKVMYTDEAPRIFFLDGNKQVVYCHTRTLESKKLYTLAGQIRKKEIKPGRVYFDKDWFPSLPAQGVYYRNISTKDNGNWLVSDFYKNNKLQMQGDAILAFPLVKTGKYSYYYESGKLSSESNYKDGKPDGTDLGYYEDGTKWYESNFANGLLHGQYTSYHPNGNKANTVYYSLDNPAGTWYYYYSNGAKRKEANWSDGKLNGKTSGWYEDGSLKFEADFKDGQIRLNPAPTLLHPGSKPAYEISEISGGKRIRYLYENGQPSATIEQNGSIFELTMHYPDGQRQLSTTLENERTVTGKYITWYANGQKQMELTLQKNKPVGKAMAWHTDGKVREKIDFDSGTREFFDEQGKPVSKLSSYYIKIKKGEEMNTKAFYEVIWKIESVINNEGKQ